MLIEPRETDTLTIESDQAYSANTPTKLVLTEDIELAGLVIDDGTILDLAGYTVNLSGDSFSIAGVTYGGGTHTAVSLGVDEVIDSSDPDTGFIFIPPKGTLILVQ